MQAEFIYEVKGGCGATIEWTTVPAEAFAKFEQMARECVLYRITAGTGVKVPIGQK